MSSKRAIGLGLGALALLSGCGTRHDTAPDTSGPDQATALGDAAEIAAERPEVAARKAEVRRSPEQTVEIIGREGTKEKRPR